MNSIEAGGHATSPKKDLECPLIAFIFENKNLVGQVQEKKKPDLIQVFLVALALYTGFDPPPLLLPPQSFILITSVLQAKRDPGAVSTGFFLD